MREYLLTLLVAATVTYLLTGAVRAGAIRFGAMTELRERDVHTTPTPRLGGVAMFAGFCAALLVADHLPMLHEQFFAASNTAEAVLSGAGLMCLLGAIDDRWGVDALTKLAGQAFAASVMVMWGVRITYLPIPGIGPVSLDPTTGVVLSILVVLVMVNAVNFVDGLDGLAAGMCAIAALAFFLYAYRLNVGYHLFGASPGALISALIVGICIGFLGHNWDPARIFMGDSGALMLGLLLAASTITLTGQIDPAALSEQVGSETFATHKLVPALIPLLLPVTVLFLPLVDMTLAVVRRTKAGLSPFAADKGHLHHRLLQIGHAPRRAVLIMYFWSSLIAFLTVLFSVTPQRRPIIIAAMALSALGMALLLSPRVARRLDARAERRHAAKRPLVNWQGVTRATIRRHRPEHAGSTHPVDGKTAPEIAVGAGPEVAADLSVPDEFDVGLPNDLEVGLPEGQEFSTGSHGGEFDDVSGNVAHDAFRSGDR